MVEVAENFQDQWYPLRASNLTHVAIVMKKLLTNSHSPVVLKLEKQFTCRYETIYFPAGLQKMEGASGAKIMSVPDTVLVIRSYRRQVKS
jgi:hypothetical protein